MGSRDFKDRRGKKEYLVHWKGYPDSDDSWVKEEDIDGEIVEEYKMKLAQEGIYIYLERDFVFDHDVTVIQI